MNKFKVDDLVIVSKVNFARDEEEKRFIGGCGKIAKINLLNDPYIYRVKFFNKHLPSQDFDEDELNFQ
jgi:hypothetical protein